MIGRKGSGNNDYIDIDNCLRILLQKEAKKWEIGGNIRVVEKFLFFKSGESATDGSDPTGKIQ